MKHIVSRMSSYFPRDRKIQTDCKQSLRIGKIRALNGCTGRLFRAATQYRLILLYKGLKGKARIPTDDLIPKNRRCKNQHSLAFQIPLASKEVYKSSFFPQTIRDWNDLPDPLISSAEMSDDCVSKFASLVRSRD